MDTVIVCQVCATNEFKYKCPQCQLKYCCLKWYKEHQEIQGKYLKWKIKEIIFPLFFRLKTPFYDIILGEAEKSKWVERKEHRENSQHKKVIMKNNEDSEEPLFLEDDDVILTEAVLEKIKNPEVLKL